MLETKRLMRLERMPKVQRALDLEFESIAGRRERGETKAALEALRRSMASEKNVSRL